MLHYTADLDKIMILPVLMSAIITLLLLLHVCISCCLWCSACCWAHRHCCSESKSMGCTVTKLQPVTNIPGSDLCALLGAGCH